MAATSSESEKKELSDTQIIAKVKKRRIYPAYLQHDVIEKFSQPGRMDEKGFVEVACYFRLTGYADGKKQGHWVCPHPYDRDRVNAARDQRKRGMYVDTDTFFIAVEDLERYNSGPCVSERITKE